MKEKGMFHFTSQNTRRVLGKKKSEKSKLCYPGPSQTGFGHNIYNLFLLIKQKH